MNVLDYIVMALAVIFVVVGVFKGLFRQILTIVGIIVVATLTATVSPYVQSWLVETPIPENARALVAIIASVILIAVVYGVVALLITKLLKRFKIMKALNYVLGGVLGLAVVYFFFAVVFALFNSTGEEFMPLLKLWVGDAFRDSWIANNIYANNPFGNWVVVDIAQSLLQKLIPAK